MDNPQPNDTNQAPADSQVESSQEFDQSTYVALKSLIQRLSVQLDEVKVKQKEYRQRLKNIMDNDSQLAEFEEQAKEANQAFRKRKKELEESAEGKEIKAKIKELREETRDLQESLTNSLLSYFQITGAKSFDTPSGEEREFKLNAKLLPPKNN